MDSITQFALGASIGEAVLGRKIGNRAPVIGGLVATLPDLDSFIPWDDAIASMTYHRSATHSLFVLAALSPLICWLIIKIQPKLQDQRKEIFILVFLALITHPLAGCLYRLWHTIILANNRIPGESVHYFYCRSCLHPVAADRFFIRHGDKS